MESRPALSTDDVIDVLATFYGLRVTQQTTLNSYDDVNIHVHVENNADSKFISDVAKDGYVLKVLNSVDSKKTSFIGNFKTYCSLRVSLIRLHEGLYKVYGHLFFNFLSAHLSTKCS